MRNNNHNERRGFFLHPHLLDQGLFGKNRPLFIYRRKTLQKSYSARQVVYEFTKCDINVPAFREKRRAILRMLSE